MRDATQIARPDPAALDYTALGHADLVNLVLQRSEIIDDERQPGAIIRAWVAGDSAPLDALVETKGAVLAQRAAQIIRTEFEAMLPVLDALQPRRIADIGCGYGFFDLFAFHRFGADLLLVDVERTDRRHFGFEDEAAGYADLGTARAFLTANGVPAARIATWNPGRDDLPAARAAKADLAVSFLACGFHFPVDMYLPFFRFGVAPGGAVILDLRGGKVQENNRMLRKLGRVEVLARGKGRQRVLVRKGRK